MLSYDANQSFSRTGEAIKKAVKSAGEGQTIRAELSVSSSEKVSADRLDLVLATRVCDNTSYRRQRLKRPAMPNSKYEAKRSTSRLFYDMRVMYLSPAQYNFFLYSLFRVMKTVCRMQQDAGSLHRFHGRSEQAASTTRS